MKIGALVILLFGLLTALYAVAVVVPHYSDANREWMSASRDSKRYLSLESKRDGLRERSQQYAMTTIACAVIGLILGLIGRKRLQPKTSLIVVGSVLCLALFGAMQAFGNIF